MKITAFDPTISTNHAADIIALFETLGFEQTHHVTEMGRTALFTSNRLKHPDGFHVDVIQVAEPRPDNLTIRINVDDFDEAISVLKAHGFEETGLLVERDSARALTLTAPSGMQISIVQHIKKN